MLWKGAQHLFFVFWLSLMMMMMIIIIVIIIIVYIRATDWVHVVWLQYNAIIRKIIQIRGVYLGIVVANVIITFERRTNYTTIQ